MMPNKSPEPTADCGQMGEMQSDRTRPKTRLIAFVLFAITVAGFTGLTQETNQPARPRPIDPHALQMQMAILKDQDIHKVEELLMQGADINAPIGCGTYGPLDGAVSTQNLEMLKFLLAHGAKPRGRELPNAAFYEDPQTALNFVKVLLSAGVNPNATDTVTGSALGCAAYGSGGGGGYQGGGGGGGYSGGGGGDGSIIDSSGTIVDEVSGVASPDDSPDGEIIITEVSEVPEPTTLALVGLSGLCLRLFHRQRK